MVAVFRRFLKINLSKTLSYFKFSSNDSSIPCFSMHRLGHQAWAIELLNNQSFLSKLLALQVE